MPPKHLLGIEQLPVADIAHIFSLTTAFQEVLARPIKRVPSLRDITVANVFFENSTRTRLSFELAAKRLSAEVINFTASSSALSKGESLLDTLQNILHMQVNMIVIRHQHAGVPHFLSQHLNAHIINAGDGRHEHPTQALLDAFSIQEEIQTLKNKNILILGDVLHSRVALSNIFCFTKLGAHVRVCAPPTLIPPGLQSLNVTYTPNLQEALPWADVIYVLRLQQERGAKTHIPSVREYAAHYGLNKNTIQLAKKTQCILHPGPMNRGVEIDSTVANDPRSQIILKQVSNGVAVRMAVLYWLAGKNVLD